MVLHIVNVSSLPKFLASIPTFWPFQTLLLVPTHLTSSGLRTVHEVIGHQQPGLQVFSSHLFFCLRSAKISKYLQLEMVKFIPREKGNGRVQFGVANTMTNNKISRYFIQYGKNINIIYIYVIIIQLYTLHHVSTCIYIYMCCIISYMYVIRHISSSESNTHLEPFDTPTKHCKLLEVIFLHSREVRMTTLW